MNESDLKSWNEKLDRIYHLEAEKHYSLESGCDSWVELRRLYRDLAEAAPALLAQARSALELRGQLDAAEQAIGRWQAIELERNQLRARLASAEQERDELRSLINECAARVMPGEKDSGESYVEMLREARQENARLNYELADIIMLLESAVPDPSPAMKFRISVARAALRPDPQPDTQACILCGHPFKAGETMRTRVINGITEFVHPTCSAFAEDADERDALAKRGTS